jgi:hypothetical protein
MIDQDVADQLALEARENSFVELLSFITLHCALLQFGPLISTVAWLLFAAENLVEN